MNAEKDLAGSMAWLQWVRDAQQLIMIVEPILETLVDLRQNSIWVRLPFLRRLKPPAEVEVALRLIRGLKDRLL